MSVLKGLKPEKVFAYFEKLCAVPHGSGNTQIISDLCVSLARELGPPAAKAPNPSSCRATWTWSAPRPTTAPRTWPGRGLT